MTVIVLGSKSQIGKDLQELESSNFYKFLSRKDVNISNKRNLKTYIENSSLVINLAAYTDVEGAELNRFSSLRSNYLGPKIIATLCAEKDIPLIHISTDYVFDGSKEGMYKENDVPNPINFYGKSKLLGENAVRKILKKHIIIRTSWIFGKHNKNFLKTILGILKDKESLEVVEDQKGSPTSSRYLADSIKKISLDCLKKDFSSWGTYNLTGFPYSSWYEFALQIKKSSKRKGLVLKNKEILPIDSLKTSYKAIRPSNSKLDSAKTYTFFGIQPNDWRKSLVLDLESEEILNIIRNYER